MPRSVFLGTKPVEGSVASRLATHWAVGVGEGGCLLWLEIDGNSGLEQVLSVLCGHAGYVLRSRTTAPRTPSTASIRAGGA